MTDISQPALPLIDLAIREREHALRYDLGHDTQTTAAHQAHLDQLKQLRRGAGVGDDVSDQIAAVHQRLTVGGLLTFDEVRALERRRSAARHAHADRRHIADAASRAADIDADAVSRLLSTRQSLIVDMDDTLISNEILFTQSRQALIDTCQQVNGTLSADSIAAQMNAIDKQLLPEFGFTPRRWYEVSAALMLWATDGRASTRQLRAAVDSADIAMGVGEVLPGVRETLAVLRDVDVPMVLKTKGDVSKQAEKLDAHRFDKFFGDRIVVIDRKTQQTFEHVARRFALTNPVSIGDSAQSDIVPALAAGLGGIYIDRGALKSSAPEAPTLRVPVPYVESFPHGVALLTDLAQVSRAV
jgi:putative hydrolase of the HAD superfamily